MASAKRVVVGIFKDSEGKDLLRYDGGEEVATLTIARANADQLETLADAIAQVLPDMRKVAAAAGVGGTTPPAPPVRGRTV